jgi:hypothetical protein
MREPGGGTPAAEVVTAWWTGQQDSGRLYVVVFLGERPDRGGRRSAPVRPYRLAREQVIDVVSGSEAVLPVLLILPEHVRGIGVGRGHYLVRPPDGRPLTGRAQIDPLLIEDDRVVRVAHGGDDLGESWPLVIRLPLDCGEIWVFGVADGVPYRRRCIVGRSAMGGARRWDIGQAEASHEGRC